MAGGCRQYVFILIKTTGIRGKLHSTGIRGVALVQRVILSHDKQVTSYVIVTGCFQDKVGVALPE